MWIRKDCALDYYTMASDHRNNKTALKKQTNSNPSSENGRSKWKSYFCSRSEGCICFNGGDKGVSLKKKWWNVKEMKLMVKSKPHKRRSLIQHRIRGWRLCQREGQREGPYVTMWSPNPHFKHFSCTLTGWSLEAPPCDWPYNLVTGACKEKMVGQLKTKSDPNPPQSDDWWTHLPQSTFPCFGIFALCWSNRSLMVKTGNGQPEATISIVLSPWGIPWQ